MRVDSSQYGRISEIIVVCGRIGRRRCIVVVVVVVVVVVFEKEELSPKQQPWFVLRCLRPDRVVRDCSCCHQEGQLGREGSGATHWRVWKE